jgi:DNA-binding beta-propeller fold protein YncE
MFAVLTHFNFVAFVRPLCLCVFLLFVFPVEGADRVARTIAGVGKSVHTGDGGPATEAGVGGPFGVVVGPDGAIYVCETTTHVIRRVDAKSGVATTVVGTGKLGNAGDGGPATEAEVNEPYEIRFDMAGDLYFVDMKAAVVRMVDAKTQVISTIAGSGQNGFSGDDGPATKAKLNQPHSIVLDEPHSRLYICDIGNHRVRVVDLSTGVITTFAGTGSKEKTPDGAAISGTPLNGPRALDIAANGDLILALREGNAVYRLDMRVHTIHHLAGVGKQGYAGDGGPAAKATLAGPKGVAIGPGGDIYLADTESHTIRVIRAASGIIETVVGDGKKGDGPDGPALKHRLARPHGIYVDPAGGLYIGDSDNHKVRYVPPSE